MCTLMILHKTVPHYPVIIAANRDEYRSRMAEPPAMRDGDPRLFAGSDMKAGGTWLGINSEGLVVGVLNRRSEKGPDNSRRSRGLLCMEALGLRDLQEVLGLMRKPAVGIYNPFNLFYADRERAYVTYCQEEQRTVEVAPGFHVLANGDMDDTKHPRLKSIFQLARGIESMGLSEATSSLQSICRHHVSSEQPLDSVCIHAEGYGTVSSTIVALGNDVHETIYLHAEGNPCQCEYKALSPLFN